MKTPLEILHKYFHHFKSERTRDLVVRAMEDYAKIYHETEVKKLQQHSVMQDEGSDVSEGAAVASSAVGSQTSARTCANGCDWPNCTLEGCVDPKCDC